MQQLKGVTEGKFNFYVSDFIIHKENGMWESHICKY